MNKLHLTLIVITVLVIGYLLALVNLTLKSNRFDEFAKQCRSDGGMVFIDSVQERFILGSDVHYGCIKDAKTINKLK